MIAVKNELDVSYVKQFKDLSDVEKALIESARAGRPEILEETDFTPQVIGEFAKKYPAAGQRNTTGLVKWGREQFINGIIERKFAHLDKDVRSDLKQTASSAISCATLKDAYDMMNLLDRYLKAGFVAGQFRQEIIATIKTILNLSDFLCLAAQLWTQGKKRIISEKTKSQIPKVIEYLVNGKIRIEELPVDPTLNLKGYLLPLDPGKNNGIVAKIRGQNVQFSSYILLHESIHAAQSLSRKKGLELDLEEEAYLGESAYQLYTEGEMLLQARISRDAEKTDAQNRVRMARYRDTIQKIKAHQNSKKRIFGQFLEFLDTEIDKFKVVSLEAQAIEYAKTALGSTSPAEVEKARQAFRQAHAEHVNHGIVQDMVRTNVDMVILGSMQGQETERFRLFMKELHGKIKDEIQKTKRPNLRKYREAEELFAQALEKVMVDDDLEAGKEIFSLKLVPVFRRWGFEAVKTFEPVEL